MIYFYGTLRALKEKMVGSYILRWNLIIRGKGLLGKRVGGDLQRTLLLGCVRVQLYMEFPLIQERILAKFHNGDFPHPPIRRILIAIQALVVH